MPKDISYDYIRGLVDSEGCFTFHTVPGRVGSGFDKMKVPAFAISMHERDEDMINSIRDKLGLRNRVYNFKPYLADGFNRGRKVTLCVRDLGSLKNIIIPLFYDKFIGHKSKQFLSWLEEIGTNPAVPESYRLLYRLHKSGFYSSNKKYL